MKLQPSDIYELNKFLTENKISLPKLAIMNQIISNGGSCNMSTVAKTLLHSTAAATGLVDRIEKDGFVKRENSKDDRRVVTLQLTPKGKKYLGDVTGIY